MSLVSSCRLLCRRIGSPIVVLVAVSLVAALSVKVLDAAEQLKEQAAPAAKPAEAKAETSDSSIGKTDANKGDEAGKKAVKDPYAWRSMFDGKSLEGWKVPQFGGEGEVAVEKGVIALAMGDPMTGITWTGELPKFNYEFRMEAQRTMGIDFFATTTFPYGDDPVSLVVGGWAGSVVGLSCVDFYDASDNLTTKFMSFKDNQWYRIRIRVTKQRIEAWIDDEKVVDLATKGHRFSIRDEVDLCKPFGICTWCTAGQLRKLEIRSLKPEEVEEIPARDRWD
jgi:hypothetical protein